MHIELENIGKRFNREWIFRDLSRQFSDHSLCAILGANGSGKSTLLQIISGYVSISSGRITWRNSSEEITIENLYPYLAICAPYLSLYDDFTLRENVQFFLQFKSLKQIENANTFAQKIELEKHLDKQLKFFSSGMKQRVKLGLAICADTPLLLLDEPASHLDANAIRWFQQLLAEYATHRTVFVASNSHQDEIFLCNEEILLSNN